MNQLGDYFDTTEGGTVSQPVGSYFDTTPGGELTPPPAGSYYAPAPAMPVSGSPDGLGMVRGVGDVLSDISPLMREIRRARRRPTAGYGQTDPELAPASPQVSTGVVVAGLMLGVTLRGVLGYYVGKAMAPNQQAESKYAWWGVPSAIVLGTLGLGIEAGFALRSR